MTSSIVVTDHVPVITHGSVERDATFLATAFTLSNFNNAGIAAWRWTLLDKPIGSSAALSSGVTATTVLTPDVPGAYLVRLLTYTDAGATVLDDQDEQLVGIAFSIPLDWQVPAAGETTQRGPRGWATPVEHQIRQLQTVVQSGIRDHLLVGEKVVVQPRFQYVVRNLIIDAGATLVIEAGATLVSL